MTEIADALSQLYALELGLTIESPVEKRVLKVWEYAPPMSQVVSDTPCFVHSYTIPELVLGAAIIREQFEVNLRLLVHDADSDQAARIASAFWPKIRTALSQNVKLGLSGWSLGPIRGATPTLRAFRDEADVAGKTLIGLDLFLTLYHHLGSSNAAGDPP